MTTTTKQPVGRPTKAPDAAATSWVQIRITRRRKAAWVKAAQPGKLTAWIEWHLDRASGFDELKR